jgi:eukaryotic-like serine/threonine-protein kinase
MYTQNTNPAKNTARYRLYFVIIFFIFAFYYLLLLSVGTNISSQYALGRVMISKTFLTYESPEYGFKIQFPSDWEKIEFSGEVEEAHRKIIVNFVSPSEAASDTFREYFIIERGTIDLRATLPVQYDVNTYVNRLKSLPNFKLIESNKFSLADSPAEKLVYNYSNPEVGVTKTMDVLIVKDERLYLLSFSSDAVKYNSYLPIIQKMFASFKFR